MKEISVNELIDLQKNGKPNILDVRETAEIAELAIPGTERLSLMAIQSGQDPSFPKREALYIHCRSGKRSLIAGYALMSRGYEDVYNVTGGILAYAEAGGTLEGSAA